MQSGTDKLISRFRTSSEAPASQTDPGCTPAEVGCACRNGHSMRKARLETMHVDVQIDMARLASCCGK